MNRSPSFSQPRPQTNESRPQGGQESGNRSQSGGNTANAGNRNQSSNTANAGNRNQSSNPSNAGAAAAGAGAANRNQSPNVSNAGAAAAGAGAANRNQSPNVSNAGAAAAGAGAANRNQSPNVSNAGAAAAGAGYANRNQSPNVSNAGAAAAGAGYANRNQSPNVSNAGAAAAGAGYANRNQNPYSNAGAAAAGATYANRNQYDQYHPGMAAGYWNGNYGNPGVAAYGGMGMASPAYGYGSMPYMNPYAGMGGVGGGQGQPINAQAANSAPNYSQPLNTSAAPPDVPPNADPSTSPVAQARQAFQSGDYAAAIQLTQQALGQTPNDVSLNEFLALCLFAQGSYEQAAAPLYAVLSVGPGWDWTTLIGNYSDASVYTTQIRGLEAFVKANPKSAKAQFVEAYQYISQGHGEAAIQPLKNVVALQPNDTLSAQLLTTLQPPSPAAVAAQSVDPGKLPGVWVAQAPPNGTITLSISDDVNFTWAFAAPGQKSATINGTYALANGVLTLNGKDTPGGPLAGQVASVDDKHMSFKAVGAPASDPGLQFVR
jgi:Tetratricopeptide repeat